MYFFFPIARPAKIKKRTKHDGLLVLLLLLEALQPSINFAANRHTVAQPRRRMIFRPFSIDVGHQWKRSLPNLHSFVCALVTVEISFTRIWQYFVQGDDVVAFSKTDAGPPKHRILSEGVARSRLGRNTSIEVHEVNVESRCQTIQSFLRVSNIPNEDPENIGGSYEWLDKGDGFQKRRDAARHKQKLILRPFAILGRSDPCLGIVSQLEELGLRNALCHFHLLLFKQ